MLDDLKSQLAESVRSLRRFLQRPISVRRGNLSLGVPAASIREQARETERQAVRRMRRDLYELMEQHASSRQLMRHLGLVERTLRRDGYKAVKRLPLRVISKALMQLERLVWDWSSPGLADLRSRLAVIVKTRPADDEREDMSTASIELGMTSRHATDVSEVDQAAFDEMERSWAGRMPDAVAAAKAASDSPAPG